MSFFRTSSFLAGWSVFFLPLLARGAAPDEAAPEAATERLRARHARHEAFEALRRDARPAPPRPSLSPARRAPVELDAVLEAYSDGRAVVSTPYDIARESTLVALGFKKLEVLERPRNGVLYGGRMYRAFEIAPDGPSGTRLRRLVGSSVRLVLAELENERYVVVRIP